MITTIQLTRDEMENYLKSSHAEFTELYRAYMYRQINIYEFAGKVGVNIETLNKLIDLFTAQGDK